MGEMKLLNTIVAVENLLCIYRNFSSLRSFSKYIAGTRVTILFVAYISTFFSYIIDTCKFADVLLCYLVTCHASLTTIITLVAVFGGISYTDSFQDLRTRIETVHKYCSKNDAYKKSINSLTIVAAVCSSLFVVAYLIILVLILWTNLSNVVQNNDIHTYMRLGTSLISYWGEFRFNVEFFIFNILIKIMASLLNQMILNLAGISEHLDNSNEGIDDTTCGYVRQELETWTSAYNSIAMCSGQLKKCYGVEVTVTLLSRCFFGLILELFYRFIILDISGRKYRNSKIWSKR